MIHAGFMDAFGRFSTAEFRTLLLAAIEHAGGQNALARELGINQGRIAEVVSGLRPAGTALAHALGFERDVERRVAYRPVEEIERVESSGGGAPGEAGGVL